MITLIARVVEVWVTLGPRPPGQADSPPLVIARDGPRGVRLLRHVLGTVVPQPQRWAALAAWSLVQIATRRLTAPKSRPDSAPDAIDRRA